MNIFKNKYKEEIELLNSTIVELSHENGRLIEELREARNLSDILNKLADKRTDLEFLISTTNGGFTFSEDVAVYVDDILGGKVIKQEGTKCILVSEDGSVTEGLTKESPDKGYVYKLVRD